MNTARGNSSRSRVPSLLQMSIRVVMRELNDAPDLWAQDPETDSTWQQILLRHIDNTWRNLRDCEETLYELNKNLPLQDRIYFTTAQLPEDVELTRTKARHFQRIKRKIKFARTPEQGICHTRFYRTTIFWVTENLVAPTWDAELRLQEINDDDDSDFCLQRLISSQLLFNNIVRAFGMPPATEPTNLYGSAWAVAIVFRNGSVLRIEDDKGGPAVQFHGTRRASVKALAIVNHLVKLRNDASSQSMFPLTSTECSRFLEEDEAAQLYSSHINLLGVIPLDSLSQRGKVQMAREYSALIEAERSLFNLHNLIPPLDKTILCQLKWIPNTDVQWQTMRSRCPLVKPFTPQQLLERIRRAYTIYDPDHQNEQDNKLPIPSVRWDTDTFEIFRNCEP